MLNPGDYLGPGIYMSTASIRINTVPDLPTSHQPLEFMFPNQWPFGKVKVVHWSFQKSCLKEWPFLHYDEAKDVAFCHTCAIHSC